MSSWASPLEDWFEESDLSLVIPTGLAMRRGKARQCDSIIDLALLNDSALCTSSFSPISISFLDSLGSDHAALSITWSSLFEPLPYVPTIFVTDCLAYLTSPFLFHSPSVSVCDSRLLCPSLTYLSMDCSCVFQRLPYVSICFHLVPWPSMAFSHLLVTSLCTCIYTVPSSIERLS